MKSENQAKQTAQTYVDRITSKMVEAGYPVEMVHKQGHRPNYIPCDTFSGWNSEYYEENLASVLIGGWSSKAALIHLVMTIREIDKEDHVKPDYSVS